MAEETTNEGKEKIEAEVGESTEAKRSTAEEAAEGIVGEVAEVQEVTQGKSWEQITESLGLDKDISVEGVIDSIDSLKGKGIDHAILMTHPEIMKSRKKRLESARELKGSNQEKVAYMLGLDKGASPDQITESINTLNERAKRQDYAVKMTHRKE